MVESLTLASDLVPEFCIAVDIPVLSQTGRLAKAIAKRIDTVEGKALSQAPSSLAGGSLYLATLLTGPNVAQHEIAEANGVNEVALRNAYQAIALETGIGTTTPPEERGINLTPPDEWPDWVQSYTEGDDSEIHG